MFVSIIFFPPVKAGKDAKFREWFAWTNEEYARHKGFIRRRLLKPRDGGNYVAIVEHESYETFLAMLASRAQTEARKWVEPMFETDPEASFYEVVVGDLESVSVSAPNRLR